MHLKRAIIFVRVYNKGQDHQKHLAELRAAAMRQKVQVVAEIIDRDLVSRPNQQRKELKQLLELCRQGTIQKVLIKDVDHIYSSEAEFQRLIKGLTCLGISIYIQRFGQFGMETFSDGIVNSMVMTQLRATALYCEDSKRERENLRERILYSQEKARRQGKTIGRPTGTTEKQAVFLTKYPLVVQQLQQNMSVRETARFCGLATGTVSKVKKQLDLIAIQNVAQTL